MLMTTIAEFSMLLWLLGFWRVLALLAGWGRPLGAQAGVVSEEPVGSATLVRAPRDLSFDTVLPGMRGRVVLQAGSGGSTIVPLKLITVSEVFGALQYLAEAREGWPFAVEVGSYTAYVALDGPGWELTVYVGGEPTAKVEYYARKTSGGKPVYGVAGWEMLAQALLLSPDYEAVVSCLGLSPYWTGHYVA